ncbi:MAG: hypothetical protein GY833_22860 [Aestuariibacter sp.]|nr:hypothetical protein [Aestuariibacter sp.]
MKTKDITKHTELPAKGSLADGAQKVFAAFLEGHIIKAGGSDYRYARKDDELFEDDDRIYVATESGFFQRYDSFSGGEKEPSGFRWLRVANSIDSFLHIFGLMSEEEVFLALGNRALTNINVEAAQTRRMQTSSENRVNTPRSR